MRKTKISKKINKKRKIKNKMPYNNQDKKETNKAKGSNLVKKEDHQ